MTAGHLRISLDMNQFEQPMTISLQSMGILSAILLALALALSLRLGRNITTPLLQLRVWLREPDPYTPAITRQDEIGDLARQLHTRLAPPAPEPEPEPEPEEDFDDSEYEEADDHEPTFEVRNLSDPTFDEKPAVPAPKAAPRQVISAEEDEDEDDPFSDLRDTGTASVAPTAVAKAEPTAPQPSAVLAVQLGAQEQLRRLPRARLMELLERYRDMPPPTPAQSCLR